MLRNTLILPESDARLAARLLDNAIHTLDVVLMLIIGKGDDVTRIVEWADNLCDKTATEDGNLRMVVWVRDVSTLTVQRALVEVLGAGPLPRVAVLNFFDREKARLNPNDPINPITLEIAFAEGHRT